jgi:hypothetical protein
MTSFHPDAQKPVSQAKTLMPPPGTITDAGQSVLQSYAGGAMSERAINIQNLYLDHLPPV